MAVFIKRYGKALVACLVLVGLAVTAGVTLIRDAEESAQATPVASSAQVVATTNASTALIVATSVETAPLTVREQTVQKIIQDHWDVIDDPVSDVDTVFAYLRGLAGQAITLGQLQVAEAAIEQLFNDHHDHPEFAGAIQGIAGTYRQIVGPAKAQALCRDCLERFPNAPGVAILAAQLIKDNVAVGQLDTLDADLVQLHTTYGQDPQIATQVIQIGDVLRDSGYFDQALLRYEEALVHYTDDPITIWAAVHSLFENARKQDDAAVQAILTNVLPLYRDNPQWTLALHQTIDRLQKAAQPDRATQVQQAVADLSRSSLSTGEQSGLEQVKLLIATGDTAASQAAADLMMQPATDDSLAETAWQIGNAWHRAGQPQPAEDAYHDLIMRWPDSVQAVWAQREWAALREDPAVLDGIGDVSLFNATLLDDQRTVAIAALGDHFFRLERFAAAGRMFQFLGDHLNDPVDARWHQAQADVTGLYLGDQEQVQVSLQQLRSQVQGDELERLLRHFAWHYRRTGHVDQAIALYQEYLDNWPGHDRAFETYEALARLHEAQGNEAQAVAVYQQMVEHAPKNWNMLSRSNALAVEYRNQGEHDKALLFYHHLDNYWPTYEINHIVKDNIVVLYIKKEDATGAQAAINDFMAEFSHDRRALPFFNRIANRFDEAGWPEMAVALRQRIIEQGIPADMGVLALGEIIIAHRHLGDDMLADSLQEQFYTDYRSEPDVVRAAYNAAYEFYRRGRVYKQAGETALAQAQFRRFAELLERVIAELPIDADRTSQAIWALGATYCEELDEPLEGLLCLQSLEQQWPGHYTMPSVLNLIPQASRSLIEQNELTQEQGQASIETAYLKSLARFPVGKYAQAHRSQLGRLYEDQGRYAEAAEVYQAYLDQAKGTYTNPAMVRRLETVLEHLPPQEG